MVADLTVFGGYDYCNVTVTKKVPLLPVAKLPIWAGGYRITDASLRAETPCHRVITPITSSGRKTTDFPPEAFLEFAGCATEENVAQLVNRYGFLGTEQDYDMVLGEDNEVRWDIAEPVSTWLAQAKALREMWNDWQTLKDPKADVRSRTFNLLAFDEFLPETPMGLPPGGVGQTQPVESNADRFPVQLHVGDELRVELDEYEAAAQAQDKAEKAFRTATGGSRDAKQARLELNRLRRNSTSRRPRNHVRMTTKEQNALEALEAACRRSDVAVRQLGWTLLGLRVTKQLRLHGVVPTLVKSPLKKLARVRQPQPTMALEHYAPHLLALVWLQLADATSQRVEYRKCAGCQKYITIHPDVHRKHRRTCSDACRQRAYRATPKGRRRNKKKPKARRRSQKL